MHNHVIVITSSDQRSTKHNTEWISRKQNHQWLWQKFIVFICRRRCEIFEGRRIVVVKIFFERRREKIHFLSSSTTSLFHFSCSSSLDTLSIDKLRSGILYIFFKIEFFSSADAVVSEFVSWTIAVSYSELYDRTRTNVSLLLH